MNQVVTEVLDETVNDENTQEETQNTVKLDEFNDGRNHFLGKSTVPAPGQTD
ncbi:hypothetical protein [Kangiella taiwanensis]|nr:hypothetical protein [Kangiella taiwanensis]